MKGLYLLPVILLFSSEAYILQVIASVSMASLVNYGTASFILCCIYKPIRMNVPPTSKP